ncbi:glycosyltransferase [Polynucleobacter sp. MWH-UH35A]|uniref:glycosyltransferase n=1 Tax=Polynucleobacter sp. MWH-UH35A TaxID=1855619 RepID=UPI001BFDBF2D|nr:glycosyltransferase [Polynucleobacter sp. MWH-UH35A]QWD60607.1 glycosyltransferase [Polynucleobacter sp. MWH-UH35A]
MLNKNLKIGVVIPSYKVRLQIGRVLAKIGPEVSCIIIVDDFCPEGTGAFVLSKLMDPRIHVIFNENNIGVGGSVLRGYHKAIELGCDVLVKIDGDDQMDPALISRFAAPIQFGRADYVKGNRFFSPEYLSGMPKIRLYGNAFLSMLTKLSSGYWNIFDPTNGYTAIHASLIEYLTKSKIDSRYFFESDMLYRLGTLGAVVAEVPMRAVYGDERSNLIIRKIAFDFLFKNLKNTIKRIIYRYFVRDFSFASLELFFGVIFFVFGFLYGAFHWLESIQSGIPSTSGQVMISALPILVGFQMVLGFINYDIQSTPKSVIHTELMRGDH